tara:strand:+ start:4060 stop:5073 length:1014 start_codon:yes stop_codon:yes gene_type:complete
MNTIIIGAGRMGRRHIQSALNCKLNISGIVDISDESLSLAKKEFDLSSSVLYKDIDVLINDLIPDCAIISTCADSHKDLTIKLSNSGVKYILVEKPMATSISDCLEMINVCKQNDTKISVNHQMRFLEQYSKPKKLLESEAYGGFKSMNVIAGNFGFSMNALHYFEAFKFLSGEVPIEVTAWFSDEIVSNPRGEKFEDRAGSIKVVCKSGKRLYMDIGSDQGNGVCVTYYGRNGYIFIDELKGDMRTYVREKNYKDLPTTRYGMPSILEDHKIKPVEVIDSSAQVLSALIDGKNTVTGEDGLLPIKILAAAYESAENNNAKISIENNNNIKRSFPWA